MVKTRKFSQRGRPHRRVAVDLVSQYRVFFWFFFLRLKRERGRRHLHRAHVCIFCCTAPRVRSMSTTSGCVMNVVPGGARLAAVRGGWGRHPASTGTCGSSPAERIPNHRPRRGTGGRRAFPAPTTGASSEEYRQPRHRTGPSRGAGHRTSAAATGASPAEVREEKVVRERLAKYTFHTVAGRQVCQLFSSFFLVFFLTTTTTTTKTHHRPIVVDCLLLSWLLFCSSSSSSSSSSLLSSYIYISWISLLFSFSSRVTACAGSARAPSRPTLCVIVLSRPTSYLLIPTPTPTPILILILRNQSIERPLLLPSSPIIPLSIHQFVSLLYFVCVRSTSWSSPRERCIA